MLTDLTVVSDTIVQPLAAFQIVKNRARWGTAFGILLLLTLVGAMLGGPAQHNADVSVLRQQFASTTDYASYTQSGRDALAAETAHPPFWHDLATGGIALAAGMVAVLVAAFALWSVSLLLKHGRSFKAFFAAMVHVAIVGTALSAICSGVVTFVAGASNFTSYEGIDRAMPSLALLAPNAKGWPAIALGAVTPFALWSAALQAAAIFVIAATSKKQAIAVGCLLFVLGVFAQIALSKV